MSSNRDLEKLTEELFAEVRNEGPSDEVKQAIVAEIDGPRAGGRVWFGGVVLALVAVALSLMWFLWPGPENLAATDAGTAANTFDAGAAANTFDAGAALSTVDAGATATDAAPPAAAPLERDAGAPPAPPRPTVPVAQRPSSDDEVDVLAQEVALLDRARSLMTTDAQQALRVLQSHRARFPRGALVLEVELLRLESLLRLGRRAEAEALASRLLARAPDGPMAARVKQLLEETTP